MKSSGKIRHLLVNHYCSSLHSHSTRRAKEYSSAHTVRSSRAGGTDTKTINHEGYVPKYQDVSCQQTNATFQECQIPKQLGFQDETYYCIPLHHTHTPPPQTSSTPKQKGKNKTRPNQVESMMHECFSPRHVNPPACSFFFPFLFVAPPPFSQNCPRKKEENIPVGNFGIVPNTGHRPFCLLVIFFSSFFCFMSSLATTLSEGALRGSSLESE